MVTMYARQLAGETNDSLRQLNVSHIKAAHLFRDSIDEVKSSQLILLYVYSPYDSGSYNNNDTGLDGVDSIQMGYHVLMIQKIMTQPTMITTVIAWMIQEWQHRYFSNGWMQSR